MSRRCPTCGIIPAKYFDDPKEDVMDDDEFQIAALSGWATNLAVSVEERLSAALEVIRLQEARIAELTNESTMGGD